MSSTAIDAPEKIGIGTYQIADPASMLADIDLTGANWFYTWRASLPTLAINDWSIGTAATLGGTTADTELVLGAGSNAWAWQTFSVAAGQSLSLSFAAEALSGATGGVVVEFKNASGTVLSKAFLSVTEAQNDYLTSVITPTGTVSASLIAYTASGAGFSIDDISVQQAGTNLVANGGFELSTDTSLYQEAFTPMIWGAADMKYVRTAGFFGSEDTLLTFNEPDNRDQANLSVSQALSYWPELMATGMRLGSPATTTSQTLGTGSWLQNFMNQADALGYRVDFIAVHYYTTNTSVAEFKAFLESVHEAYDRPIWVTEWALADWANENRFSAEQQRAFFEEASRMLDDLPFVEKHAWFGMYDGLDSWDINTGLVDSSGNLTTLGASFAELADLRQSASPTEMLLAESSVAENASAGTCIGFIRPIDETPGDAFTFSLIDNAGGRFAVNASTGELTVINGALLDYEQAPSHAIVVRVTDVAGHALEKQIVIDLTNVAEPRLRDGTTAADIITVDTSDDWSINGLAGNDVITTRGGADTIRGGAGDDRIVVSAGDDVILFSGKTEGFDTIEGGDGHDRILALSAGTTIGLRSLGGVETISANGFAGVTISGSAVADALDFSGATLIGIERVNGGAGNDLIIGTGGSETIAGGVGNDALNGCAGDDTFLVGKNEGIDAISGGEGTDTIRALSAGTVIGLSSISGVEVVSANGFGAVTIAGSVGDDVIDLGSALLQGIQQISGGSGNDRIVGSAQADVIAGNAGADQLWGNGGADVFKFGWIGDSRSGGTGIDLIQDFEEGLDRIDLTGIDASTKLSGNQAFTFIGGAAFGKVAGQIRVDSSSQSATVISGDVNGDGIADFRIDLTGFHQLAASDFFL